ncbi:MAG TPA: hypothetical protein EYQ63_31830 [Fuerstia sp.]|nr:hypothetical protein [Fuerstiella sp.]
MSASRQQTKASMEKNVSRIIKRQCRPNHVVGQHQELDGHHCFSFGQDVHFNLMSVTYNVVIPPL